ncbi:uncharacterized protein [Amphiura filiformis]|uniref:uncharacterized protein n=1 Tax=Amphiura filiformis TaxID=82378 RepID=UPI003B211D14
MTRLVRSPPRMISTQTRVTPQTTRLSNGTPKSNTITQENLQNPSMSIRRQKKRNTRSNFIGHHPQRPPDHESSSRTSPNLRRQQVLCSWQHQQESCTEGQQKPKKNARTRQNVKIRKRTVLYLGENFAVKLFSDFKFQRFVENFNERGLIYCQFETFRHFNDMNLSLLGQKLLDSPNAGGNSVESEVLSYELLHRCYGARLAKTEMEVVYFPEGGSITDYTCEMFGTLLGVSVTRAMKYKGDFTLEDADKLLNKKLNGIVNSTQNTLEKWSKQILHVWATSHHVANMVTQAYRHLPTDIQSNTVVFITVVVTSNTTIFCNS